MSFIKLNKAGPWNAAKTATIKRSKKNSLFLNKWIFEKFNKAVTKIEVKS